MVCGQWNTIIPLNQKIAPNSAGDWQNMGWPSVFRHPVCKLRTSCGELEPELLKLDQY